MADAKRCDRCHSYYDNNRRVKLDFHGTTYLNQVVVKTTNGCIYRYYDLCDNCVEDFMQFIAGAGIQEE